MLATFRQGGGKWFTEREIINPSQRYGTAFRLYQDWKNEDWATFHIRPDLVLVKVKDSRKRLVLTASLARIWLLQTIKQDLFQQAKVCN